MRARGILKSASVLSLMVCLGSAQGAPNCLGGASTVFRLVGGVETPKAFTPAKLADYRTTTMTVSFYSGASGLVTKTYVGVPLLDLLNEAVVVTDSARKNDIQRKYLVARATDCYESVVSMAEVLPNFGAQHVLVAYATVDAAGVETPLDDKEGALRLVVPGDKAGGRFVSNLDRITVRSAP